MIGNEAKRSGNPGEEQYLVASRDTVVRFQRYLTRKSWGTFFAMWALVMLIFLVSRQLIGYAVHSEYYVNWSSFGIDLVSFSIALWYVRKIFEKARRTERLERPSENEGSIGNAVHSISWVLLFSYIVIMAVNISPFYSELGQFIVFLGFVILMYRSMKRSFHTIPIYGLVTIPSFIAGDIVSVIIGIGSGHQWLYYLDWGSVILLWLIGSLIAFWNPDSEWEGVLA